MKVEKFRLKMTRLQIIMHLTILISTWFEIDRLDFRDFYLNLLDFYFSIYGVFLVLMPFVVSYMWRIEIAPSHIVFGPNKALPWSHVISIRRINFPLFPYASLKIKDRYLVSLIPLWVNKEKLFFDLICKYQPRVDTSVKSKKEH